MNKNTSGAFVNLSWSPKLVFIEISLLDIIRR